MSKIGKIFGAFWHGPERFDALAERIAENDSAVNARVDELTVEQLTEQLCRRPELLKKLNRQLSITPTIWGDPARIEIDETADLFTCFFNVNSGRIRAGKHCFAGPGVSLLAGSHDPQLTGYLRRDAEMTEGCDITLGDGVWLAGGCTLLGPCTVHDNAVIASGAVVIPGTEVPAGTIWGGIPAREIGKIELADGTDVHAPAVREALKRYEGFLCLSGWSAKSMGVWEHPARFLRGEGTALTTLKRAALQYRLEGAETADLRITGPGGEKAMTLTAPEGKTVIDLPAGEEEMNEICFRLETAGAELLLAVSPEVR